MRETLRIVAQCIAGIGIDFFCVESEVASKTQQMLEKSKRLGNRMRAVLVDQPWRLAQAAGVSSARR
jgi:hypothetical protein